MRPTSLLGPVALVALVAAPTAPARPSARPAPTPGARAGVEAPRWIDLVLPEGLRLELATGEVTSRAVVRDGGALTWAGGRLTAEPELLALGPEAARYALADGQAWSAGAPEPGDAFAFVLGEGEWGVVRVLAVAEDALRLEYARAPAGARELVRIPAAVEIDREEDRLVLSWPEPGDARYRVRRRVVGEETVEEFEVAGGAWLDPTPPRSRLVEYRVARVDAPMGARAWGHRVVTALDEELEIARGARIDLLAGEVGGARADVEVIYLNAPSIALRPLGGAALEPFTPGAWIAPAPGAGRYQPDRVRTTDLGVDLSVRLEEAIYARVSFRRDEDGSIHLRRSLALDGSRRFPLPPGAPTARWTGDALRVEFAPLEASALGGPALAGAGDGEGVVVVAERELELDGGRWREVEASRPGARVLSLEAGPRDADLTPLVRYRFRHRTAGGRSSPPGEATLFLRGDREDPEQVARWLEEAFANLTNEDFDERLAARRMIEALGEAALPRLELALVDDDPEVSLAARELLGSLSGASGPRVGLLLRAQATRMGRTGPAAELPPGLDSPDPVRRAWALLAHWRAGSDPAGGADDGATWLDVIERADPDPTLARFAELLGRLPRAVSGAGGRPAVETPPAARPAPGTVDLELAEELDARLLARHVERAVDVRRPGEAWVLLALVDRLARAEGDAGVVEDARLALRLLARWKTSGDEDLLRAARSLASDPAAELAAWRSLVGRRASSAPPPVERPRVRLEQPGWDALVTALEDLEESGASYVDVVLPAGEYGVEAGAGAGTLVLGIPGLRLVAEGEVVLRGAVQVNEVTDVILEGLTIEHTGGTPLYVRGGEVHARKCRIVAYQTAIVSQGGRVELEDVVVSVPEQSGRARWAARLSDGADLWARGSLLAAGTLATGPGSSVYLEGCVLAAGGQNAIQGQRGERVTVRDSLLVGEAVGIAGVERGLLAGVLLDFAREAVARGSEGVRLSPALAWTGARTPPVEPALFLATCPLAGAGR